MLHFVDTAHPPSATAVGDVRWWAVQVAEAFVGFPRLSVGAGLIATDMYLFPAQPLACPRILGAQRPNTVLHASLA